MGEQDAWDERNMGPAVPMNIHFFSATLSTHTEGKSIYMSECSSVYS